MYVFRNDRLHIRDRAGKCYSFFSFQNCKELQFLLRQKRIEGYDQAAEDVGMEPSGAGADKPAIRCPKCGQSIPDKSRFCNFCGTALPEPVEKKAPSIYCSRCGEKLPEGVSFCGQCGAKVSADPIGDAPQTNPFRLCPHCKNPTPAGIAICSSCGVVLPPIITDLSTDGEEGYSEEDEASAAPPVGDSETNAPAGGDPADVREGNTAAYPEARDEAAPSKAAQITALVLGALVLIPLLLMLIKGTAS